MALARLLLLGAVVNVVTLSAWAGEAAPAKPAESKPATTVLGYVLRPLDVVSVDIIDDSKASHDYKIGLDGATQLTYLKPPVKLAGYTTVEAAEVIGRAYKEGKIFTQPQITVSVKEYAARRINVLGQVNHPGWVIIPPEEQLTLVSAVAQAGGATRIASLHVTITRKLPDGQTQVFKNVDLLAAMKDAQKDFPLQDGDTIYIEESLFG